MQCCGTRNATGGFDRIWCLGDMVGYGPDPSACLRRLRGYDLSAVAGNHDFAAAGVIDAGDFNGAAFDAIRWTANQIDEKDSSYLAGLPQVIVQPPFTLVHGSLRAPIHEYLTQPLAGRSYPESPDHRLLPCGAFPLPVHLP